MEVVGGEHEGVKALRGEGAVGAVVEGEPVAFGGAAVGYEQSHCATSPFQERKPWSSSLTEKPS